jgi:hypothetical protein
VANNHIIYRLKPCFIICCHTCKLQKMKKFVLSIIIAAGGLVAQSAQAQVGVSVGMQIGPLVINVHKPTAPAVVYDDFYYLPDVEAYYSVPEQCYYYMDGNRWVNAAYLPGRYRNYDWRNARRYEVRTQRPYANHDYYRNKFGGNRGGNWNDNRRPERRDDRRGNDRFPSSPYDSNNAGGRGGYNRPDRRDDDNRYERGGNRGGEYDNDRGGNYNGQPNRNNGQGNNGQRWNGGQNGNGNGQPGRGNGQGNYGQPSNNQPSNQNGGRGGNRGNDNQDRGREQRYTQNNGGDRRIPFGSVEKVSF